MVNPHEIRAGLPVNIPREGILYEKTSVDESNHILKGMRSCHSPFSRRLPLCALCCVARMADSDYHGSNLVNWKNMRIFAS